MCEFTNGNSVIAIEHALMKNGSIVNLGTEDLSSFLNFMSSVAFMSSENVKKGIESDSVIVFVIAFFIPVIFFTLNRSVKKNLKRLTSLYQILHKGELFEVIYHHELL